LWQISEGRGEGQWYRFVHEALRTPETTRQLKNRAELALHATIGLDAERRAAVERLLLEQLQNTKLGDDHRTDVALAAAALENQSPASSAAVASVLAQAMNKTNDDIALRSLAEGLSAVAGRMEAKDAADAAAVLAPAMNKATHIDTLRSL